MLGFNGALESGLSASRIGVRDMLSHQSLIPVGAGTPRYENVGRLLEPFGCHLCHPSAPWIPAFAGMTNGGPGTTSGGPWNAGTPEAAYRHFRTNE